MELTVKVVRAGTGQISSTCSAWPAMLRVAMRHSLLHQAAVAGSIVSSSLNLWRGGLIVRAAQQPALPITLFEYEGCPYCRLVREALTALHLDVEIRPCPRRGTRFRPQAEAMGGKLQFPLLVDENTNTTLYESIDIIEYLFRTYGARSVPSVYRRKTGQIALGGIATFARFGRGILARRSRAPAQALHLWSFEASPYSRLVRERLCELELPYTLHNLGKEHWKEAGPAVRRIVPNPYVPREGGKRHAFWSEHGRVQLPYLEDPNTGSALFDSERIVLYLESTYAA